MEIKKTFVESKTTQLQWKPQFYVNTIGSEPVRQRQPHTCPYYSKDLPYPVSGILMAYIPSNIQQNIFAQT